MEFLANSSLGFCPSSPTPDTGLCVKKFTKGNWFKIPRLWFSFVGSVSPLNLAPVPVIHALLCQVEAGLVLTLCWLTLPRREALTGQLWSLQQRFVDCREHSTAADVTEDDWGSALAQIQTDQSEDLALCLSAFWVLWRKHSFKSVFRFLFENSVLRYYYLFANYNIIKMCNIQSWDGGYKLLGTCLIR